MNKRLDILVVHPNASSQVYQDLSENFSAIETPIWAAMIGSFLLKKGWSVELLDCEAERLSVDDAAKRVKEYNPRILCVVVYGQQPSASSQNMVGASALMSACSSLDVKRVYVGPTPSALPEVILGNDLNALVVRGEGPHTLNALLKLEKYEYSELKKIPGLCYKDNLEVIKNPYAPLITDLDNELTIDWSLLPPVSKYRTANWHSWTNNNEISPFASIYTSLGCPFQCLAGDTLVNTIYGKIPIKELSEKYEDIMVYTMDPETKTPIIAKATHIKKYGENEKLVRVNFTDGSHIDCTPDHKFMAFKWENQNVSREEWISEAKDLTPGIRLPAIRIIAKGAFNHLAELESVTDLDGLHDTYCLTVEGYDWFFANDVFVKNCSFCMINSPFNGGDNKNNTFRHWLPENTIKTLDYLADQGVKNLKIADEMFVLRPKHFLALCNLIIERGHKFNIWAYARVDTVKEEYLEILKKAGVNWLALGIESGNRNIRLEVTKGKFQETNIQSITQKIRDHGINVLANYIFGLPSDTKESMKETFDLALSLNSEYVNLYTTLPYPGSQLHRDFSAKDPSVLPESPGNPGWVGYSQHSVETFNLPTDSLSRGEILKFRDESFIKYFSNPNYIKYMTEKFGNNFQNEINKMLEIKLVRK
jgi:hypothetical protein